MLPLSLPHSLASLGVLAVSRAKIAWQIERWWARVLGVGHACALRGCDHERIDRPSASPGALCVGVTMSALTGASVRVEAPGVPQ